MKPKNCKAGQRVIIKENDSGIEVGTKGVILEDSGVPLVAILEGELDKDTLSPSFTDHVVMLGFWEIKKDEDYPNLVDITKYVDNQWYF